MSKKIPHTNGSEGLAYELHVIYNRLGSTVIRKHSHGHGHSHSQGHGHGHGNSHSHGHGYLYILLL